MFPLKPRDELVFGISSNIFGHLQTSSTSHDLNIMNQIFNTSTTSSTSATIDFSTSSSNTRKTWSISRTGNGVREIEKKRAIHRNIERQRRQEMSQLYASLRSLLPIYKIKGKHSLSDVMHESKNYIQNLQKNVQELRVRRDNIKKLSISSGKETNSSNGKGSLPNYVEVNKNQDVIEILISSSSESRLSSLMIELTSSDIELNVINCVSTKVNGRFLHKIHAEANDVRLVNLSRLQEKLTGVMN